MQKLIDMLFDDFERFMEKLQETRKKRDALTAARSAKTKPKKRECEIAKKLLKQYY